MGSMYNTKIWGTGICLMIGLAMNLPAQINKTIQSTTKTVTSPLKETQKMTKEAVQPIKEVRTTTKTVTNAPKEVTREVQATEKAFDNAGNEVKRAKTDVDKAVDKIDGDKEAKPDSANKAESKASTSKGTVIIDETGARDEVRDGGGYGDLNSKQGSSSGSNAGKANPGNTVAGAGGGESQSAQASAEINYDYRRVLLPPGKGKTNLKSVSKKPTVASAPKEPVATTTAATPAPKAKPDYSSSPAREALESADFQMETLADLFQYAEWDGPSREHTMRSIDFSLKQLKKDIDDIRYKDANRNVWDYEKQYREWRDAYVQQGGQ